MTEPTSKAELAKLLGVSRSSLYYQPKLPDKDWLLKIQIENVLHKFPSYGHKRLALHLGINKKRALRVMKLYGIKPYRRKKKPRNKEKSLPEAKFENLLLKENNFPTRPSQIWASDFTYLPFKGSFIYLATIIDLFTREVVGFNILNKHSVELTSNALIQAILTKPTPEIIHSDQGREYVSQDYTGLVENLGIQVSMSRKASPWENGYQEGFYSQFKTDLGDPDRFTRLGQLVYAIYRTVHIYNNSRIHSALKKPPAAYAADYYQRSTHYN